MTTTRLLFLILSTFSWSAFAATTGKVCFFTKANFSGQSFCMPVGAQEADLVPSGWNDRISSIIIEGKAEVEVYRDINYSGQQLTLRKSVVDLASLPGDWNDQISSFVASGIKR